MRLEWNEFRLRQQRRDNQRTNTSITKSIATGARDLLTSPGLREGVIASAMPVRGANVIAAAAST